MRMGIKIEVGKYIRAMREQKDIALVDLAKQVKISKSHLSEIENCVELPSWSLARRLATALDSANLLLLYLKQKYSELDDSFFLETALRSEIQRINEDNPIPQILSLKTSMALLSKKETTALAAEAFRSLKIKSSHEEKLRKKFADILSDLKSLSEDIKTNSA